MAVYGDPFGDVYPPYLIVPGIHILWATAEMGRWCGLHLNGLFEPYTVSVISVVIVPGVAGIILGAVQWYVIGSVADYFGGRMSLNRRVE